MKGKLFLAVGVCLFLICAARAQKSFLIVSEAETEAILLDKTAEISLVAENRQAAFDASVALELLDIKSDTRAQSSEEKKIRSGKGIYKISLPLSDLMQTAQNEIAWYRLRYRITDKSGRVRSAGVVSLSEILSDVFDVRVVASERVFAGTTYRTRVRAVHPFTRAPVKNVKISGAVELSLDAESESTESETDEDEDEPDELKIEARSETDGEGFAILNFKIPPGAKLDDAELKIKAEKYGFRREVEEDLDVDGVTHSVYLNTDKPLYQPGQIFNARGILIRENAGESSVVPNAELEFSIKDEEGTLLYRETAKTSRFGIASVAWQIP